MNLSIHLGKYQERVERQLKEWRDKNFLKKLWSKDTNLWPNFNSQKISQRLGWLDLPEIMDKKLESILKFAEEIRNEGVSYVVLLGMGGSSLAAEVFQKTFKNSAGYPRLVVLDSTHPLAVRSMERNIVTDRTLFLVSSKSGTTIETLSLFRYFWNVVSQTANNPGHQFVAISDPESPLVSLAKERDFRHIFLAPPDVGGRYSAFSVFGLVPAALIGMDIKIFLGKGKIELENNNYNISEENAPGLILGAALGELADDRDKLTFLASPSLRSFPLWAEQLVAESTGKDGKGIIPVIEEPVVSADSYGNDRLFVFLLYDGDKAYDLEELSESLCKIGHPIFFIQLSEKTDLGGEIFRWEIATASAGALLGLNPFDEPDVKLAKDFTKKAMKLEKGEETESSTDKDTFYVDDEKVLREGFRNWVNQFKPSDYIAIQAYLPPFPYITQVFQKIRLEFLKKTDLATTLGYGPRFMHSSGQLHKGGPNTGHFLQIIDEPELQLRIPETDYSFRTLIQCQAFGDYKALCERGREALRISLGKDTEEGLMKLWDFIRQFEF